MQRFFRPLAALLIGIAAVSAVPLHPASAHGGTRVLRTEAGPYRIEAFISGEGSLIDETIAITDVASGDAVPGAAIALTLEDGAGRRIGPFLARALDGAYEVRYPPQEGGSWTILIEVQGAHGSASVRHPYRAPDAGGWGGRPGILLNLLLGALLIAAVLLVPRLGRCRRDPAPPADTTVATRE